MTFKFPFVLLPKRVTYVDDDGRMLDILRMTMPKQVSREFIGSPDAALGRLQLEAAYWRSIELLLSKANEQSSEGSGEAPHYVGSYFQDWRRFHLTGVLIVDYAMPGLNGLELIRRLGGSPARRILLTGQADAEIAVQAFNSGLIQKFIPKSTPNLHKEITRSADEMHHSVCEHLGHLVRGTLRNNHVELLYDPSVVRGLTQKVEELEWTEYVVVGTPFGLLGMSNRGPLQWLQVETADSLKELSAAMTEYGYPEAEVRAVSSGTAVPVNEIKRQLGIRDDRQLVATEEVSSVPEVYCAVIELPIQVLTASDYGVDDIRTPEELMRALLRDVDVADRRAGASGAAASAQQGVDDAVANLVSTASLSQIHAQAFTATMNGARLDPQLKARIQAQVSITMISGRKNGPSR